MYTMMIRMQQMVERIEALEHEVEQLKKNIYGTREENKVCVPPSDSVQ